MGGSRVCLRLSPGLSNVSDARDFSWLDGVPPLSDPRLQPFLEERGLSGDEQLGVRWALFMRLTGWSAQRLASELPFERRPELPGAHGALVDLVADTRFGPTEAERLGPRVESVARTIRRYVDRARERLAS